MTERPCTCETATDDDPCWQHTTMTFGDFKAGMLAAAFGPILDDGTGEDA